MPDSQSRLSLVVTCIIFFFLGLTIAALGPVLPELAANAGTTLAGIGSLFTAFFLGALVAQLVAGPVSDRTGQRPVLLAGVLLLGLGLLGLTLLHSLFLVLLLAFMGGLGHGSIDLGSNVLIGRVFAGRSVSALNLLNFFFGFGAFVGPALVSLALSQTGKGLIVLWIDAAALLILAPFVLRLPNPRLTKSSEGKPGSSTAVYRSAALWSLGVVILVYVGIETGLGGWITTYVNRTTPLTLEISALVSSGFWLALTIGRLVTALVGNRFSSGQIMLASLVGSLAGGLLFAVSTGSATPTIFGVLLTGFSYGAVYPTVMSIVTMAFHQSPGKAAGVIAAMGSVGGMTIPWLQGIILDQNGPQATAWVAVVSALLMLVAYGFSLRDGKRGRSSN